MSGKWYEGWSDTALTIAALALIVAVIVISYTQPAKVVVDTAVDVVRSVDGPQCLAGWTETSGTDPDTKLRIKVCTSPDRRYVITVRENQAPRALDTLSGEYLTPEQTQGFLR